MGSSFAVAFQLDGIADIAPFIKELKPSSQSRILGDSMGKAGKPIAALARAKAPKDTGALKKAIGVVVRRYPEKGKVMGLIGARHGYFGKGKKGVRKLKIGESHEGSRSPAFYSHLVEYGHKSVHGGGSLPNYGEKVKGVWNAKNKGLSIRKGTAKATSFVAPRPFLAPAVAQGKPAADAALAEGFAKAIEAEHKRAARKFKKSSKLKTA